MFKTERINSNPVVFSKWSRKAYAVFSSLKRVVNIGQLSVDISTRSMIKLESLIRFIDLLIPGIHEEEDPFSDEWLDDQSFLQLMPINILASDIEAHNDILSKNFEGPYTESNSVWAFSLPKN